MPRRACSLPEVAACLLHPLSVSVHPGLPAFPGLLMQRYMNSTRIDPAGRQRSRVAGALVIHGGQAVRPGSGRDGQWRSGGYVPQLEQVWGVKPDATVREPRAAGTNRAVTAQRAVDADQGVP